MHVPVYCPDCCELREIANDSRAECHCPTCGVPLDAPDTPEVFISYSSKNHTSALQIARHLQHSGIYCWFAPFNMDVGDEISTSIADAISSVKAVVVLLSPEAIDSTYVGLELNYAVHRRVPVFATKVAPCELPGRLNLLITERVWSESHVGAFEHNLDRLADRLLRRLRQPAQRIEVAKLSPERSDISPPKGVLPHVSPYVGPQPFRPEMADRFFGRDHELRQILEAIEESRIVLVYAPSGAGKSSLLNTKVRTTLTELGMQVLPSTRVGGEVPASFEGRATEIENVFVFLTLCGFYGSSTPDPACSLADYFRSLSTALGERRALVLDQFEEIFTQHRDRHADRIEFIKDMARALGQNSELRVIIAIRQEYLANFNELVEGLPDELKPRRIRLKRLDEQSALKAITLPAAPFAHFDEGVAEELVRQLNTMRVNQPDGTVVRKRGEFIELVHLQIVCERLWRLLPENITLIEHEHLRLAAGDDETLGQFVDSALVEFYRDTVRAVSCSERTRSQTKDRRIYPEHLIQLGCMGFVDAASVRVTIRQDDAKGRTGRLPNWIVEQLEAYHLLRVEMRGGEKWFELAHDLLADVVSKGRDQRVSALLSAAEMLNTLMKKCRETHGGSLVGYFSKHPDILAECQPFVSQPGLFVDEAEFIFRASLAAGERCYEWSERVSQDFPDMHTVVLSEAIQSTDSEVRRNATALLGMKRERELDEQLIKCALYDPDSVTRQAAAASLAKLEDRELMVPILDGLQAKGTRRDSRRALALMLIAYERGFTRLTNTEDGEHPASAFSRVYKQIRALDRYFIRASASVTRLFESGAFLLYVTIPATLLGGFSAAFFKWLPASQNFALCQADPNFTMGIFHGIAGGCVWGGVIAAGIALNQQVLGRNDTPASPLRPFSSIIAGVLFGFLSGSIVTLEVAGVYQMDTLHKMGWLNGEVSSKPRFSTAFWYDLFVATRFGWAYIISGVFLGIGMAMTANNLRTSRSWRAFLASPIELDQMNHLGFIFRRIAAIVLRSAWPIVISLLVATFVIVNFLNPTITPLSEAKTQPHMIFYGTLMDCVSQIIGGFSAVVGMGLGILVMRQGIYLRPRGDVT
ncbi:MAG: TIR domain-containing protein [Pirellulaceae bacterium]|nr:TIR domain-containing protein [Pirellulaceae bacterium]